MVGQGLGWQISDFFFIEICKKKKYSEINLKKKESYIFAKQRYTKKSKKYQEVQKIQKNKTKRTRKTQGGCSTNSLATDW